MSHPPPTTTQSVLDLLASYSSTGTADPNPHARFASARLERQASRAARLKAQQDQAATTPTTAGGATEGEPDPEQDPHEAGVVPRLRVQAPTSAGGRTSSPTIPGTPKLSPSPSLLDHGPSQPSIAGDLATPARPAPTNGEGAAGKRRSMEVGDIPPYKGPASRPSSPVSVSGAGGGIGNAVKSRLAEKLKAQHRAQTPDPSQVPPAASTAPSQPADVAPCPAKPPFVTIPQISATVEAGAMPVSPVLVPIPTPASAATTRPAPTVAQPQADAPSTSKIFGMKTVFAEDPLEAIAGLGRPASANESDTQEEAFHDYHAMSPITERTEHSSMFTRYTDSVHHRATPFGSLRSSTYSSALSARPVSSIIARSMSDLNLDHQMTEKASSVSQIPRGGRDGRRENVSPTRKPSPELARRAALFTRSTEGSSSGSPSICSTPSSAPPSQVSSKAYVSPKKAAPPASARAAPSAEETRYVPAGWEALRRETEDDLTRARSIKTPTPVSPPWAEPAPSLMASERLQSEAGIEPRPLRSDDPPAASSSIIYEGTLLVPPSTSHPTQVTLQLPTGGWKSSYCVLTSSTLEARPTDRGEQKGPVVMLYMADCVDVRSIDEPSPSGVRAFEVKLLGGARKVLGVETRLGRTNWVLALEKALPPLAAGKRRSPWSSASPSWTGTASTWSSPGKRSPVRRGLFDPPAKVPMLGGELNETAFFASPSQLSTDPGNEPVLVSRSFPLRSDSTRSIVPPNAILPLFSKPARKGQNGSEEVPGSTGSFRSAHSRARSDVLPLPERGAEVNSLRSGVTADQSSLFGGVGLPSPQPQQQHDLFGYLDQKESRGKVPSSGGEGPPSPRKALPQLPSHSPNHARWGSQPAAYTRPRVPPGPQNLLPGHVMGDLAAIAEVIQGAMGDEERRARPHTLATDVYFLLKAVLTKLRLSHRSSSHNPSGHEHGWVEGLLLPLIERLFPSNASGREPSAIHRALMDTLSIVRELLAQPSHSPTPGDPIQPIQLARGMEMDRASMATEEMVLNEEESTAWSEQRRNYATEASDAAAFLDRARHLDDTLHPARGRGAHVPAVGIGGRTQETPTPPVWQRVREVRAAERTLAGRNPYGPSTVGDSMGSKGGQRDHYSPGKNRPPRELPPRRRNPFEQVIDDDEPSPVLHPHSHAQAAWAHPYSSSASEASSGRTAKADQEQHPPGPPRRQRPLSEAQRIAQSQGWARVPPSQGTASQAGDGAWNGTGEGWKQVGVEGVEIEGLMGEVRRVLAVQENMMTQNENHRKKVDDLLIWMSGALVNSDAKQNEHFAQFGKHTQALKRFAVALAAKFDVDVDEEEENAHLEHQVEEGQEEPTVDRTQGGVVDPPQEGEVEPTTATATGAASGAGRVKLGGFALIEDGLQGKIKRKLSTRTALKGPRGIRIWGAPAGRASQWASAVASGVSSAPPKRGAEQTDEEYDAAVAAHISSAEKKAHQPLIDAIRTDEGLAQTLEQLASGGEEVDAGSMALAVFEILQSMRDIHRKQAKKEAAEAEDRVKNGGLSKKEVALLELKKAELAKLEQLTQAENTTTTKLDQLVAEFNRKEEAFNASLARIEGEIKSPARRGMDPELVQEGKRLLDGVRNGVDGHVKDFRGRITGEVQRMFKEVGKLRDEKKNLQTEIAELMAFQARQSGYGRGGGGGGAAPAVPAPAPAPAPAPTPAPAPDPAAKPGMAPTGWFGPR